MTFQSFCGERLLKKGYLITFEGIDGSGKTTQAELLYGRLRSHGRIVQLLREPGGTPIGERIRSILLDVAHTDMSPLTELFLYLAARAQLTASVILPALDRGEDVILDRFIDSTVAYQGYARGLGIEETTTLNRIATRGLVPDLTFVIDCEPACALGRLGRRRDRLESEGIQFMKMVREGFLVVKERERKRVIVCDGSKDIEEVELFILRHVFERLGISVSS